MTVCVDLIGRLGNNLFQIAMCIGYAEKHKVDFYIPSWKYSDCFKTVFTKWATGKVFYGEKGWYYEELPFIADVKFLGFFQSYKYFEHCEEKIRELFQFNEQIKDTINNKYKTLPSNTCGIHIRRGDYIGNAWHEVCNLQYYNDATKEMKNRTNIDLFCVFSDDILWCKENLKDENFLFVEENSDIEDLYLMTQCKNHIISNSSFSWWGSWLSSNQDKIVISPKKWFNDENREVKDLLPENWIKIKII